MKKLVVVILFFCVQLSFSQEEIHRGYKVKVGDMSPQISLSLLDGTAITNKSLEGKVVVLQFTASWCSVCRKEMPHLEKEVWQRFKSDDFILIGIDLFNNNDEKIVMLEKVFLKF